MASRIHILDDRSANRIAAGEVIERPASVVKELIDNALDAGGRRIDIETRKGGKQLIRITDDGGGMNPEDALLSLERHATSKIRSADDLLQVGSLGFRGEALPSIASVSKFRLLTREPEQIAGTEVVVDGGKLISCHEAGCAAGTTVEVASLFHHVPGRRKFLKADATERAHIDNIIKLAAMVRHDVAFHTRHDGGSPRSWPACAEPSQRLTQIHGNNWLDDLIEIKHSGSETSLRGWIGKPGVSRGSRQDHHLFVNGRPVQSPALNFALIEGYRQHLVRGRFPVAVLFLQVPAADIDVNVHPAKREVRFRREWEVREWIASTVADALRSYDPRTPIGVTQSQSAEDESPSSSLGSSEPAHDSPPSQLPAPVAPAPRQTSFFPDSSARAKLTRPADAMPLATATSGKAHQTDRDEASGRNHDLEVVGLMLDRYIMAESPDGVVLVDWRAARERIIFESLLERFGQQATTSQRLLHPVTVDLPGDASDAVRSKLDLFHTAGIDISHMGGDTWMIDALPPVIDVGDVAGWMREVGEALSEGRAGISGEEHLARLLSQRSVRQGKKLREQDIPGLLHDLHCCQLPYTCPDGRPTMIMLSRQELGRKFGRS